MKHIGHDYLFEIFLEAFDRIELRGIWRQKDKVKWFLLFAQELFYQFGIVDAGIVEYKHGQLVGITLFKIFKKVQKCCHIGSCGSIKNGAHSLH